MYQCYKAVTVTPTVGGKSGHKGSFHLPINLRTCFVQQLFKELTLASSITHLRIF